ncbi:MAG TPA: hypothetical protein VI566_02155 [Xanthomonadales bacterium]|nr:hypothetical protein [Xanthomonadales bacterium]
MIPLPYLTVYRISGADAADFLQAQLAGDITGLEEGQSCFAAWCSPRGQVIALLLLCREAEDWLVVGEEHLARTVFKRLPMYVLRARVSFKHLAGHWLAGVPQGPVAVACSRVFAPAHSPLRYAVVTTPPLCPASTGREQLDRWRAEELKHGVVWLQPATSERFLPQMLGLERIGAVSFSKGCYPGQEIVARTRYLGLLKRKPVLLEIDGSVPVTAGAPCRLHSEGQVLDAVAIDSAMGETGRSFVLAVAPLEESAAVDSLEITGRVWPSRRLAVALEN